MTACQHRNTTFDRSICCQPCDTMHTFCDDCNALLDDCANEPVDPANWTREQAQAAQAELDELERTDPDVAAAAASYDRMVERVNRQFRAGICDGCHPDEMDAACSDICRTATPAERAAADELTRELETVYGQLGDGAAVLICKSTHPDVQASCKPVHTEDPRHAVAACFACQRAATALLPLLDQALAAERAAIHARYAAAAQAWAAMRSTSGLSKDDAETARALNWVIRQVAVQ